MKQTPKRQRESLQRLHERVELLHRDVTRSGLHEYAAYLKSPRRIIWSNLLAGVARGFGFVVGATVVVTVVTVIISYLTDIPLIGEFFRWLGEEMR